MEVVELFLIDSRSWPTALLRDRSQRWRVLFVTTQGLWLYDGGQRLRHDDRDGRPIGERMITEVDFEWEELSDHELDEKLRDAAAFWRAAASAEEFWELVAMKEIL